MKRRFLLLATTVVLLLLAVLPATVFAATAKVANVLVYSGPGTWADGRTAFERFLAYKGLTYQEQSYGYVNTTDLRGKFDVIYFSGGDAYQYNSRITAAGKTNIRTFVSNGGGYLGICAGAYFACDRILWEGGWQYYTLDLFMGYGAGAIDQIAAWPGYAMTCTTMNPANPLCLWDPAKEYMLYYGGGAFYPDAGQAMDVVATWDSFGGAAAMIDYSYGTGHVVLSGPHPEIEEDDSRDGTTFGDQFDDLGSDWGILWTSLDYLMNRTLTHAPAPAAEVFLDGFEGTWGWQTAGTGATWAKSSASKYQGSYSAYVKQTGIGKVAALSRGISTAGYSGLTLSYYRKVAGFDPADEYKAEWSDGTNWYVLEQSGTASMNDAAYVSRVYTLPAAASNNPAFRLRFSADCGAVSEWVSIDNIRLTGTR